MTPLHNTTTQTTQAPFATVPQQVILFQSLFDFSEKFKFLKSIAHCV